MIITGKWKKDVPGIWWWKCRDCTKSSGTLNEAELDRFRTKGMVAGPISIKEIPEENSFHPKEREVWDDEYYGYYF